MRFRLTLKRSPTTLNTSSTIMVEASGLGKRTKSIQTPRNSPKLSRASSLLGFHVQKQPATQSYEPQTRNSIKKSPNVLETKATSEIFKPKLPFFNIRSSSKHNLSVNNNHFEHDTPPKFRYYHSSMMGRKLTIRNDSQKNKDNIKRSSNGVIVYNLTPTLLPKRNKIPSRRNNYSQELIEDPNDGQLYRSYSKSSSLEEDQEFIYSSLIDQPNSSLFYTDKSNAFLSSIPKIKVNIILNKLFACVNMYFERNH
jgi:hypothetical protein